MLQLQHTTTTDPRYAPQQLDSLAVAATAECRKHAQPQLAHAAPWTAQQLARLRLSGSLFLLAVALNQTVSTVCVCCGLVSSLAVTRAQQEQRCSFQAAGAASTHCGGGRLHCRTAAARGIQHSGAGAERRTSGQTQSSRHQVGMHASCNPVRALSSRCWLSTCTAGAHMNLCETLVKKPVLLTLCQLCLAFILRCSVSDLYSSLPADEAAQLTGPAGAAKLKAAGYTVAAVQEGATAGAFSPWDLKLAGYAVTAGTPEPVPAAAGGLSPRNRFSAAALQLKKQQSVQQRQQEPQQQLPLQQQQQLQGQQGKQQAVVGPRDVQYFRHQIMPLVQMKTEQDVPPLLLGMRVGGTGSLLNVNGTSDQALMQLQKVQAHKLPHCQCANVLGSTTPAAVQVIYMGQVLVIDTA